MNIADRIPEVSLIVGGFDYECDPSRIQSAIQRAKGT